MYGNRVMRHLTVVSKSSGFTLIELLVAGLVGLLVLAGVHRIFVAGLATQSTTSLETEVNRKAQVAMDDMMDRLRGSSGVEEPSGLDEVWFVWFDPQNNRCHVSYGVKEGKLYRYWGAAKRSYTEGIPVASDVSQLRLSYYDHTGQPASDSDQVVRVRAVLEVARGGQSARLESAVRLRNK